MATQVPGDNRARAQGFGEAQGYDDERYKYGSGVGTTGEKELNRYGDLGAWGQNRQGVQMDTSQMGQSRGSQADALAMMRARANGRNLASDLQSRMNLQRAMQQQAALAGSARGPAGLAMAQQNAASNMANAAQGINAQAAYEAAREQAAAEQAYFGAGTGMRGQDFQQSYGQAQLNDAQRARNDAYQLEMERQRQRVAEAQLQANLDQQRNKSGANTAAEAQNQETARQNAANEGRWTEKALATVEKVGGGVMALSDERTKYMASPGETKDFFTPEQVSAFRDPAQASAFTNARGREGDWAMDYRNTGPGPLEPGVGALNAQGLGDPAVGWTNRALGDRPTVESFAKSREGQPGAMFGEDGTAGPEMSAPGEMAPGTADYMHAMGGGPDLKGPSEAELTPLQRFAIGYNGGIGAGLQLRSGLRGAMAPPQGQYMASPAGTKQFLGPSSGPGEASSYAMTGGGLDTLGSIQKINDQQVQATTDPTGGMTGGPGAYGQQAQAAQLMGLNRAMSDERAKEKAYQAGLAQGKREGVLDVAASAYGPVVGTAAQRAGRAVADASRAPTEKELQHSDKVEAMKRQAASKLGYEKVPRVEQASAEPPQPAAKAPAMVEIAGKMYPADRINNPPPPQMVMVDGKMYPADKIASDERTKDPGMESYLDSTRPSVYKYKDQFQGMPGTQPGPQVGPPSAQDMAKTPVGSTMIEEDPETGMLAINKDKALKTTMSAVSYVNKKVNNLSRAMKKGGR
jgi:hypothetical protein